MEPRISLDLLLGRPPLDPVLQLSRLSVVHI